MGCGGRGAFSEPSGRRAARLNTGLGTGGGAARRDVTRPSPEAPAHSPGSGRGGPGPARARPPQPPPRGPPPPVEPRLGPSRPRPATDSACERPKPRRQPPLPPLTSEGRAHDPAGTNRAGAERLLQSLNRAGPRGPRRTLARGRPPRHTYCTHERAAGPRHARPRGPRSPPPPPGPRPPPPALPRVPARPPLRRAGPAAASMHPTS